MSIAATVVEPEFTEIEGRHTFETWKVTGSTGIVGDTVVIKSKLPKPDYIIGPFTISSISGPNVTVKALVPLGTDATGTIGFQLYSRAGSGL